MKGKIRGRRGGEGGGEGGKRGVYVCACVWVRRVIHKFTLRAHKDGRDWSKPSVSISCEPNAEMR